MRQQPLFDQPSRITTLNCGLGRDSLTMLLLCLEGKLFCDPLGHVTPADIDVVVFSDTGCEWPHTYALLDRVDSLCRQYALEFLVLAKGPADNAEPARDWLDLRTKAATGAYHYRPAIIDDFRSRATVASLGRGDCTDNHKIQPIRRMLNDLSQIRFGLTNRQYSYRVRKAQADPHVNLIGIAADEATRIPDGDIGPHYVTEAYPLVDMGITKDAEVPILTRWGFDDVRKSGCWMCPYQPASWWWALSESEPATYARAVEYERVALERNPRMAATGFRVKGNPITITDVVKRWRAKNPDATIAAVLAKQYSRCTKEVKDCQRSALASAT